MDQTTRVLSEYIVPRVNDSSAYWRLLFELCPSKSLLLFTVSLFDLFLLFPPIDQPVLDLPALFFSSRVHCVSAFIFSTVSISSFFLIQPCHC